MRAIPSLTGLRGVAAVWVLLFHLCIVARAIGAGWVASVGILPAGWVGVDLFFVLSGFILMWNHGADFERQRSGRSSASPHRAFSGSTL